MVRLRDVKKDKRSRARFDFYTVPHKLDAVKRIICDMVQKKESSRRQRYPAHRRARSSAGPLSRMWRWAKAMDAFRDGGIRGDVAGRLSEAMGINRPSLYGTFGDKRELFLKAYERYRAEMAATFARGLRPGLTLRETLEKIYATASTCTSPAKNGPRGCFTVMTATSEAMADPEIRAMVQKALGSARRGRWPSAFKWLRETGELPPTANVQVLAQSRPRPSRPGPVPRPPRPRGTRGDRERHGRSDLRICSQMRIKGLSDAPGIQVM